MCTEAGLGACLAAGGVTNVETRAIDAEATFHDFDDYWLPFLGGQGPAAGFVTSLSTSDQECPS